MSTITVKTVVRCPIAQADRRLSAYIAQLAAIEGGMPQIELRANLPAPPHERSGLLEQPVTATLRAQRGPVDLLTSYAVTWAPDGAGPYPTFVGNLWVGALEDDESFELILDGWYESLIGTAPSAADGVRAVRVAESSAANLTQAVGRGIEAAYLLERSNARAALGASSHYAHSRSK